VRIRRPVSFRPITIGPAEEYQRETIANPGLQSAAASGEQAARASGYADTGNL